MSNKFIALLLAVTFIVLNSSAANVNEPNNISANANPLPQDTIMQGASSSGDYDYFIGIPSSEGTIKVFSNFNASNSGNDFYLYVYNKNLGIIGSISNTNSITGTDTLSIYCVSKDTLYFRVLTSYPCNYSFRFSVDSTGKPDAQPNESAANATYFSPTDSVQGRIGYSNGISDNYDWYKSLQPSDGMLRIYVERINTSNNNGADFYLYTYNKNQSAIGSLNKANEAPGVTLYDTLDIYCRASDTVFFRVNSSYCYSYKFRYEVIDNSVTDLLPNETAASAIYFNQSDTVQGKIGYATTVTDNYDWYKSLQPSDGMLRIYVERINTSSNAGADFIFTLTIKIKARLEV